MSRAGWWREYATARVVGPATDPNLPVRARRRLLKRNKLGAAHDPTVPGDRDLVSPLTIIVAAAPLPGRILVATAIDPRIMSKRLRSLRNHPNERDPKQRDPACNLIWTCCHRRLPHWRPAPPARSCQPYARWPAFAYRVLLSLVSDCGNLSNDRTTLVGWDVRRWLRNDAAAAVWCAAGSEASGSPPSCRAKQFYCYALAPASERALGAYRAGEAATRRVLLILSFIWRRALCTTRKTALIHSGPFAKLLGK
jgi:hypothetical protein